MAQFYTPLSDKLMKVLNKCYTHFVSQNHAFSFSLHKSESFFSIYISSQNTFLNFHGRSKADLLSNHNKIICQDDYKAIATTDQKKLTPHCSPRILSLSTLRSVWDREKYSNLASPQ